MEKSSFYKTISYTVAKRSNPLSLPLPSISGTLKKPGHKDRAIILMCDIISAPYDSFN